LKKEPKNFCETGLSLSGEAAAKLDKSFLLLFVKKEDPPSCPPSIMRWHADRKPRPGGRATEIVDLEPLRRRVRSAWQKAEALAAGGRIKEARALLERAHRLAPTDQNLVLAVALIRLRDGDATGAAQLFAGVAGRHDVREAWTGLATASLLTGDRATALHACASALRAHVPDPGLAAAASAVIGESGWCGLAADGTLICNLPADAFTLTLDGATLPCGTTRLPPGWRTSVRLDVQRGGGELLGSPIAVQSICRIEGFVERVPGGIAGWAWQPAAPEHDPVLRLLDGTGRERRVFVATSLTVETEGDAPCARPRGFACDIDWRGPVRVIGEDGRDLAGSPVAELPDRVPAVPPTLKYLPHQAGPVDVVIPVFRGLETTLACLDSVLETVPPDTRLWVVNDGSPDSRLMARLRAMASAGRIALIGSGQPDEPARNRGFPAAANAGLRAAGGRDVVLLNSDTLVAPGWLTRLQQAAHSAPDIGTATPISNEASILSVPDPSGGNPAPDLAGTRRLAALAASANAGRIVTIPTAHGFCMFIRADCRAETGPLRDDLFAQGYGEENDFCWRARALGWRHVAVPSVYVAHAGGASFGASRKHLLHRNQTLLRLLHPGYHEAVAAHLDADPLFWARRRLDAAVWREQARAAAPCRGAVLLVTHDQGGGTERVVASRVAALLACGFAPLLLRGRDGLTHLALPEGGPPTPNLRFDLPGELAAMVRLLAPWRPAAIEMHHRLGHHTSIRDLPGRLGVPTSWWVHDHAWLCPRVTLTAGDGRYCGEPPPNACNRCIDAWGRLDEETIDPAGLRMRSADDFGRASSLIVPSADVAARLRRHIPSARPDIRPWAVEPPFALAPAGPRDGPHRVAVIGAIGVQKGFDIILSCATDAAARNLNLFFTIVGYTVDDDALEATGRVSITGPFKAEEAEGLIRSQHAKMALIPSTWPETWCFALTDAWEAGLPALVFDIGTQAQRVRETGRGWVLPLGLPPARVNDRLLQLGAV
jgi:GT2 family glycosyltransferase